MHRFRVVLQPPGQQVLRGGANPARSGEDYARRKGMSVSDVERWLARIWGMTRTDSQICHFSLQQTGAQ